MIKKQFSKPIKDKRDMKLIFQRPKGNSEKAINGASVTFFCVSELRNVFFIICNMFAENQTL
jgi:hypothetical protein